MIQVLLFADLEEIVGQRELSIEFDKGTVLDVKNLLNATYPRLLLDNVMVAVNEEYAELKQDIKSGDIVAFIPPVSGG
ncbi:molybdopterin converting factor subunit 1 [Bacillus solitudinis]|uniref:molybdopterin converting factor subunit 1 n=1 Tax=Bacillus solitudinis TaxID=2014074 RepID=UPI000C23F4E8|nr:molybdopterin converting factor subunit 1 [Bacillus solitudinis]